ncbi:MAG: hypothetical protein ACPGRH_02555 [Alphaproteobacteria bacterium]
MKLTLQNYLQGAVLLILGIVLTLSYFQCSIPSYFPYFNSNASACGANEIIDDIYHQDSADGLDEIIPRDINNCDSDEDVDMTDVEQLLEMLSNEISFLDNALNDSKDYDVYHRGARAMYNRRQNFDDEKINDRCFRGEQQIDTLIEIRKLKQFIGQKTDTLFNLAYNQ